MRSETDNWSGMDSEQDCRGSQGSVTGDLFSGRSTTGDIVRDWWL